MLDLAAQLAAHGPLRVLDGGNQFNVYPVARAIRRRTSDLNAALQRIVLSRAVRWHLDRRILCYGNKTVVFD